MSWLIDTLFVTGLLIAAVLVLRGPVSRLFGPGMAYALWALPLLRLLVPPLTLPADPVEPAPAIVAAMADSGEPVTAAQPEIWDGVWALAPLLQALWLTGALAYLGWRAWQYRAMRRVLVAGAVNVGEADGVLLIESPGAPSPVAFGIRERVVALPPGFMAQTPRRERDLAIAHELEHHRGRDLAVNLAMQPLLALHWFNPLAWAGWRALRRDQEAACDARVLSGRSGETREAYGRLIAAFAQNRSPALASPLACPILLEKSIVHRLRSMTMTEPTTGRRMAGRLLLGAAALALPLTATITYAASEPAPPAAPQPPAKVETRKVHKIVIVDSDGAGPVDESKLYTRRIERDGKAIVLKTRKPLSDAEAEARIAKVEADLPEAPQPPLPPVPPALPEGAGHVWIARDHSGAAAAPAAGERREVRTIVMRRSEGADHATMMAHDKAIAVADCNAARSFTTTAVSGKDDRKIKRMVAVCAKAASLAGLRKARERVAADPHIPAEAREEVVQSLDAEIAEAEKSG